MFLVTSFPCHQYQRIFISKTELGQTQLTSWTNSFLCLNVNILSYPTLWWCQVWHVDLAIQTVTLCSPLVQSTSQQVEAAGFLFQLTISSHNLRGTRAKPDFLMPTPTIYIYMIAPGKKNFFIFLHLLDIEIAGSVVVITVSQGDGGDDVVDNEGDKHGCCYYLCELLLEINTSSDCNTFS